MRKIIFLLSITILGVILSACGPSTEELLEYMSQTQTADAHTREALFTPTYSTEQLLEFLSQTQAADAKNNEPLFTTSPASIPEGYVQIPDMVGMERSDAYELLEELGLIPKTFWVVPMEDYVYGQVTDCEPGTGEIVALESEIILDVVGQIIDGGSAGEEGGGGGTIGCGSEPDPSTCSDEHKAWCSCMGYTIYICMTVTGGSCGS